MKVLLLFSLVMYFHFTSSFHVEKDIEIKAKLLRQMKINSRQEMQLRACDKGFVIDIMEVAK